MLTQKTLRDTNNRLIALARRYPTRRAAGR